LLLPVAFVFLVAEGGGSSAVTEFGVGVAALLGVGGVSVGVVGALTDSVAAAAPVAVTGSTPVEGLSSGVDCAFGGAVSSDPPLLMAWSAVAG
jgi:hypothetical protein